MASPLYQSERKQSVSSLRLFKAMLIKKSLAIFPNDHQTDNCTLSWESQAPRQRTYSQWNMVKRLLDLGMNRVVSSYIWQCVTCRRLRRSVEIQRMADLPPERKEPSPPFVYTGMDCFGPFFTKQGRKAHKRYGLLFTCFCSQAIHIEMLDDLSTDSFINGLRCFIAIRGSSVTSLWMQHIPVMLVEYGTGRYEQSGRLNDASLRTFCFLKQWQL